ncbi:putative metal-binding motif-containing protein [Myxococcus qinghaiensis]|uniref:putative metal-binding motif-containing protein n=1 Tax=Myxococcus qinghaiensis TaxID=2906758 RepID=UPI0020A7D187|nr:putative metal-binding motif-containing protein [Myxococcus qinghaiensis]MCP3169572.1 putative metal-binding motif-containing protein [Myxococcus qinghaiensis]
MTRQWIQAGWGLLLLVVVAGCRSGGSKDEPRDDAGPTVEDAGSVEDAGPGTDDGGSDAGVDPLACEKQQGVCAGARRAWVDGAYEQECTGRSYGTAYEAAETRCDGLDNDCDGVTDPEVRSRVTRLDAPSFASNASSFKTAHGVFMTVASLDEVRILRLDSELVLQATTRVPMPWMRTGGTPEALYRTQLVRTVNGLALYYSTLARSMGAPLRAYLVPLDDLGAPIPLAEGGLVEYPLLDRPLDQESTRVATSPTGDRLAILWRSGSGQSPPIDVMGTVTDVQGQVLTAPKVLFTHTENSRLELGSVIWLRNGEVLAVMVDVRNGYLGEVVRLRRFDANLDPIGEERSFETTAYYAAMPLLVDLGAARGGPLESPVLVMRMAGAPDWIRRIQVVQNLFSGGVPEDWAVTPPPHVAWFGALADEGVLRLGWLSSYKDFSAPSPGGNINLGWSGRLSTLDEGHAQVERFAGAEPLSLHGYSQWVLLEKLEPRRMGTLYMTATTDGTFLDAVRYCTP